MALNNIKKFIGAGFDQMQIALLDSNSFPAGINGSVSNGDTAFMRRFAGVKTAEVNLPDNPVVSVTGDDGLLGTFQFESNEPRSFNLNVGELDLNIMTKTQGTSIYTVGTYYDFVPFDPEDPTFKDCMLLLSSQSKSVESGKRGAGYWHLLLPLVQLTYKGAGRTEQEANTHAYTAIMNRADKFPWGNALSSSNVGKTGATGFIWWSKNRMTLDTYRYDGSDTTFLLSRVPYTDANGIIRVAVWRSTVGGLEGVDVTGDVSIVAATKTVTISGVTPKTAGDYFISLVEYE